MQEFSDLTPEEQEALKNNFLQDPDAFYQKAEDNILKKSLGASYKQRFLDMTRLMKMQIMLSKAKITTNNSSSNQ